VAGHRAGIFESTREEGCTVADLLSLDTLERGWYVRNEGKNEENAFILLHVNRSDLFFKIEPTLKPALILGR